MKDLSLPRLFRKAINNGKKALLILLVTVAGMTAVGFFAVKNYNTYRERQVQEQKAETAVFTERHRMILESVENYRYALEQQKTIYNELQKYRNESVLMRLEPSEVDHYILKLEVSYPEKVKKTQAQKMLIQNLKTLAYEKGTETDAGSLTETVSIIKTDSGLELDLMHNDPEKAEAVLFAVSSSIPSLTEEMNMIYKSYQIKCLGTEIRTVQEPTVKKKQEKIEASISSSEKQIEKLNTKIEKAEQKQQSLEEKMVSDITFEPVKMKPFLLRLIPVSAAVAVLLFIVYICIDELTEKEELFSGAEAGELK